MRRKKRELTERDRLEALLSEIGHGTLASVGPDGWPVLRPLNFVLHDGAVYFHGAHKGEKMDVLADDDRVSFLAVKDYSIIPSFFTDPERACPATQYFRSVLARGRASVVDDPEEKALVLQALMEKLQPEGGFVPITADDPLYNSDIKGTAIIRMDVDEMVGKENLAQDQASTLRDSVETGLEERGTPLDAETLTAMRRCPVHGEA